MANVPQYWPQVDGIIQWSVHGTTGGVPAGTRRIVYHKWFVLDAQFDNVFVWNNTGTTEAVAEPTGQNRSIGAGGEFESWEDYVKAEFRRKHLKAELVKEEKKLKKVKKQIKEVEKKVKEKRTEGILANLLRLEFKKDEIQHRIEALEVEMVPLEMFLEAEIDDDDEDFLLLQ